MELLFHRKGQPDASKLRKMSQRTPRKTVYNLQSCRAAWFPSHNLKWTMPYPPTTLDNLQKIEIQYSSPKKIETLLQEGMDVFFIIFAFPAIFWVISYRPFQDVPVARQVAFTTFVLWTVLTPCRPAALPPCDATSGSREVGAGSRTERNWELTKSIRYPLVI